jgi:hypothetical protein
MTMVEILVSVSLLGILMGAALSMYFMTTSVVASGRIRSELMGEAQKASTRLTKDIEGTALSSLSIDLPTSAASMMSAQTSEGSYALQANGELIWQRYLVYYLQEDKLHRLEINLDPAAPQRLNPTPIEDFDPGGGKQDLSSYLADGRVVAHQFKLFELEALPDFSVKFRLAVESPAQGRRRAQAITIESVAYPRN